VIAVGIVVVPAALSRFLEFATPLFRLLAVFPVFADCLFEVLLSLVNTALAFFLVARRAQGYGDSQ
jgi:hypothetical protein